MRRIGIIVLLIIATPALAEWSYQGDLSVRVDDLSDRPVRSQYRLRLQPAFTLSERWSLNGFLATGDRYDNTWNTIHDNDDVFNVRRAFLRYAVDDSKTEVGIIPAFKGRVSSIGLSKEGWIRGARGVFSTSSGKWELVLGDLDQLDARFATSNEPALNYVEIEYSSRLRSGWSFEIGAEELFEDRFIRGELRYELAEGSTLAAELIRNISTASSKIILSSSSRLSFRNRKMSLFSFYSYANVSFGQRAALSEDFVDFGHALSSQLKGQLFDFEKTAWFARVQLYEGISRLTLGIEMKLH